MNSRFKSHPLIALYIAALFLAGCFPEDSIQWSDDGSIGVVKIKELIGVVDGRTDRFQPIACKTGQESTELTGIGISADGKLLAYSVGQEVSNLADALKQLPPSQLKLLEHYAKNVRNQIVRYDSPGNLDLEKMDVGPFRSDAYRDFLECYVCENADEELIKILTPETVEKGKVKKVGLYKLFVASPEQAVQKQGEPLFTSIFAIFAPKISPDNKHVAFTLYNEKSEEMPFRFALFAAKLGEGSATMQIADFVAPAFSWQPDGKALVFLENSMKENEDEYSIGTLRTMEIADENDVSLAEPASNDQGAMAPNRCTGRAADLAGVVYHPFMKVQCTPSRIFFSSHTVSLPMNTIDGDLRWSVYCYDQVTRSVSDILPRQVSAALGGDNAMGYFALSPDQKRIILPLTKHRFMIYKLGEPEALTPIEESEAFGDSNGDNWKMMPAWKGSSQIAALVSKNSHFGVKEGENEHPREEIVTLDAEGNLQKVLSQFWPNNQDPNNPQE